MVGNNLIKDFRPCCDVFLVLMTISAVVKGNSSPCRQDYQLKDGVAISLNAQNLTTYPSADCTVVVKADRKMLLRVDLVYRPQDGANCQKDFIQIGNDVNMIGEDAMTTYTFCDETETEVVSRGNKLWLVYKTSQAPVQFKVEIKVVKPVHCDKGDFVCSPVQCISNSLVCNGIKDCENGKDEFCYTRTPDPAILVKTPATCFRCADDTCISPRTFVYDDFYSSPDWYLCDGFSHCPDSWDENPDACWTYTHGDKFGLIKCNPKDRPSDVVKMWKQKFCAGDHQCTNNISQQACSGRSTYHDFSPIEKQSLIIVLTASLLLLSFPLAFLIYKIGFKPAGHRPSTTSTVSTTCAYSTSHDGDDCHMVSSDDSSFCNSATGGAQSFHDRKACEDDSQLPLKLKHSADKLLADLHSKGPPSSLPKTKQVFI